MSEKIENKETEIVAPELVAALEAQTIAEAAMGQDTGYLTLSTGVVIEPLIISKQTVSDLMAQVAAPEPPMYDPGDKGKPQPHYDAPSYKKAMASYEAQVSKLIFDYVLIRGLDVISVPDHLEPEESDGWLEEMLYVMRRTSVSDIERHLMWFREIAAPTEEDTMILMYIISRDAFVSEEGVNDALASLKSDATGG